MKNKKANQTMKPCVRCGQVVRHMADGRAMMNHQTSRKCADRQAAFQAEQERLERRAGLAGELEKLLHRMTAYTTFREDEASPSALISFIRSKGPSIVEELRRP